MLGRDVYALDKSELFCIHRQAKAWVSLCVCVVTAEKLCVCFQVFVIVEHVFV